MVRMHRLLAKTCVMSHVVCLLRLFVGMGRSPNMGPSRDEPKFAHDVVHPVSASRPHGQPVPRPVEIERVLARHCLFLLRSPNAKFFDYFAFEIFLGRLNHHPPVFVLTQAMVL